MAKVKTWKPGQLITIDGIVYRIMRCKPDTPFYPYPCDGCAFAAFNGYCMFSMISMSCSDFIRMDYYFVKVWPKCGKLDK